MKMAEYKSNTETGKCIFCEIASKRLPPLGGGLFYESEKYLAWLSPFPNTLGFSVVIPKKHFDSDVLAMPDSELTEFLLESKKVSNILLKYYASAGRVGVIFEGTGINHAHIKLVPMHGTSHLKEGVWKQYSSGKKDFYETYSGFLSSHDGPKADFTLIEKDANNLKKIKI